MFNDIVKCYIIMLSKNVEYTLYIKFDFLVWKKD